LRGFAIKRRGPQGKEIPKFDGEVNSAEEVFRGCNRLIAEGKGREIVRYGEKITLVKSPPGRER